jgi:hypothetical protein
MLLRGLQTFLRPSHSNGKTRTLLLWYATIFVPPAHPVGILRGKVPCYSFFGSGRCVPPTLTPLPTPLATTPNPSATCPVTGSIPAPLSFCSISLFLQPTTDHGNIGNAPLNNGCPYPPIRGIYLYFFKELQFLLYWSAC